MPMFVAAQFAIAKILKKSRQMFINWGLDTENVVYMYYVLWNTTRPLKRKSCLTSTWMHLEITA